MYGVAVYVCEPPMVVVDGVSVWVDGLAMTVWGRTVVSEWLFGWVPMLAQSLVNLALWLFGQPPLLGWPFNNVFEIEVEG